MTLKEMMKYCLDGAKTYVREKDIKGSLSVVSVSGDIRHLNVCIAIDGKPIQLQLPYPEKTIAKR